MGKERKAFATLPGLRLAVNRICEHLWSFLTCLRVVVVAGVLPAARLRAWCLPFCLKACGLCRGPSSGTRQDDTVGSLWWGWRSFRILYFSRKLAITWGRMRNLRDGPSVGSVLIFKEHVEPLTIYCRRSSRLLVLLFR